MAMGLPWLQHLPAWVVLACFFLCISQEIPVLLAGEGGFSSLEHSQRPAEGVA